MKTIKTKTSKTSKPDSSHISRWLGRIFSLEFLGVVIGAVALWFTYITFIQEKPGVLRLSTEEGQLDEDINTVFYGFSLDQDSIVVMDLPMMPILGNMTTNTISDITVLGFTPKGYETVTSSRYLVESEVASAKKEISAGKVAYALSQDKIHPMDGLLWPVSIIYANPYETLLYPIEIYYSYKSKKTTHIVLFLVGIPNKSGNLATSDIEKEFLKKIRPYLLSKVDPNKTAIICNNKIIQAPSIKALNDYEFNISDISKLK